MKKANRSSYRYTHDGKKYASYHDFMKAVRKSEHDAHNWKVTKGFFAGILLKPFGQRRNKQFNKATKWEAAHYTKLEAEHANARWGGEI